MSLMSPNGYFGNMLSTIHLLASTGVTFPTGVTCTNDFHERSTLVFPGVLECFADSGFCFTHVSRCVN